MNIEIGPNSKTRIKTTGGLLADKANEALQAEYGLSMTNTETVAVLAERLEDSKAKSLMEDIQAATESVNELRERISKDMTRNSIEKLHVFEQKSKSIVETTHTKLDELARHVMQQHKQAVDSLFTVKALLTPLEQSMLPKVADLLSQDESELSVNNVTQSEAKLLLTVLENYPSVVNPKQYTREDIVGVKKDLNARFTPEAYGKFMVTSELNKTIGNLVDEALQAKRKVLPSEILEQIKKTRVA